MSLLVTSMGYYGWSPKVNNHNATNFQHIFPPPWRHDSSHVKDTPQIVQEWFLICRTCHHSVKTSLYEKSNSLWQWQVKIQCCWPEPTVLQTESLYSFLGEERHDVSLSLRSSLLGLCSCGRDRHLRFLGRRLLF